jgi:predicted nucleotidyltransferase
VIFIYKLKSGGKIPKKLVDELRSTQGLICSVIFGSFARGEEGKSSDIDILNIYKDKESMGDADLTDLVFSSEANRVVQFVNMTKDEIELGKNDSLVSSAFQDGEILFLKHPLCLDASKAFKEHNFSIIKYDLSNLENKEKVRFLYKIYGKGEKYKGILDKYPGEKLGKGAVLISKEGAKKILEICENLRIGYEERNVWV